MKRSRQSAFTFVEVTVAGGIFAMIGVGLLAVVSTTTRLMARNLATNHGHEAVRTSGQRMVTEMHDAASPFTLIDFDGTNYSTMVPVAGPDVDPLSEKNLSQRANGVAFRHFAGGPYPIVATGAVNPSATSLNFDFSVNGTVPYQPEVGDKISIPGIKQTFDITAVTVAPTTGSPQGTVSIAPRQLGYNIAPTGTNMMTGYFLRRAAYTVWNNELHYHPNFTGTRQNTWTTVRQNITSPRPFSLLYSSATAPVADIESLHVSLEAYDTGFSARRFLGGATTYQTVVSPRTKPVFISNTD